MERRRILDEFVSVTGYQTVSMRSDWRGGSVHLGAVMGLHRELARLSELFLRLMV